MTSVRIYWFSGTGNSLWAAKRLAAALSGAELRPLAVELKRTPVDEPPPTLVGLVFPVYAWGPPRAVARFLARVPAAPRIFAVALCAGMAGGALGAVRASLQSRGLDLAAGYVLKPTPSNYPPLGGAPAPAKAAAKLAQAEPRLQTIAARLVAGQTGDYEENGLVGAVGRLISRFSLPHFAAADKHFRADEKCTSCGLCAKLCPVGNIEMASGRPRWKGDCEQCFACFHWCPAQAVQFGRSAGQHRYHHPEIRSEEMLDQAARNG